MASDAHAATGQWDKRSWIPFKHTTTGTRSIVQQTVNTQLVYKRLVDEKKQHTACHVLEVKLIKLAV